mgnify:CR=1 FL=1
MKKATLSNLPCDFEMEQHALGAMLRGGTEGAEYYQYLNVDLFSEPRHVLVATAVQEVVNEKGTVEFVHVLSALDATGARSAAGGLDYLNELAATNIVAAKKPIQVVVHLDDYRLRRFALQIRDRPVLSTGQEEYEKLLAEVQAARRFIVPPAHTAEEAVLKAILEIDSGHAAEVPIGIVAFDRSVGARRGDLVMVGGRTSAAKTVLGLNMARGVVERGAGAIVHSFEMSAPRLIKRIFAHYTGIENWKVQRGRLSISEKDMIGNSAKDLRTRKLFIRDQQGTWPQHLAAYETLVRLNPDIELLVVDYIGLIHGIPERERHLQLGVITRDLKNLAHRLNILVVALSQLNRKTTEQERPTLENFRESGSLEQDSDICVLMFAPEYKENKSQGVSRPEKLILDIAKHRDGNVGEIDVCLDRRFCRIVDWPAEAEGPESCSATETSEEIQAPLSFNGYTDPSPIESLGSDPPWEED